MRKLGRCQSNVVFLTGIRLVFSRQELCCAGWSFPPVEVSWCLCLCFGCLGACFACLLVADWPGWCVCRLGWLGWAGPSKT